MLSNKDRVKAVVIGALAGVLIGVTVNAIETAFEMPDALWSNTTNECVNVVNYDNNDYSCENLPSKYNKIWVQ
jgi:hypothetical protein|tara:strand:+ start:52 stop:270 length:219 start_codon:yes stop_codon:yes gene_type:complete